MLLLGTTRLFIFEENLQSLIPFRKSLLFCLFVDKTFFVLSIINQNLVRNTFWYSCWIFIAILQSKKILIAYHEFEISTLHDYLGPHVYSCRRNYPPHMFIWDHMIIRATRVHTYILDENSLFFLLPFQIRHCFDDTLASRCSTAIKKHIPCLSLMSR